MAKYRKIPVVIEAYQIPPDDDQTRELPPHWLLDAIANGVVWQRGDSWCIKTSNTNTQLANVGEWIIRGVENELYACPDSIFQATYEREV